LEGRAHEGISNRKQEKRVGQHKPKAVSGPKKEDSEEVELVEVGFSKDRRYDFLSQVTTAAKEESQSTWY
jgi:hypothetical protein